MAAAVVVERDGDGRLVVRKAPLGDDDGRSAALLAEAAWLRRAAGPGVAVLVGDGSSGDGLATLHAGAHTWRTGCPGPEVAGDLAAGLLRTVDRLHRQGLVHGAISPDHVVLGADGPVLCSPRPGADDPSDDRLALAQLFEDAIERWAQAGLTVPDGAGWDRAVDLLRRQVSGWALDDIAALVQPPAAAPGTSGLHRRLARGSAARRRVPVVAAAVAAAVIAVGLGLAAVGAIAGPASRAPADRAAPPASDPVPAPVAQPGSGSQYRTDQASGVLATAPTPCPGTPPAAVLQPDTGEVWAFTALPASGQQVRGVAVQRVPGADRLEARTAGSCQRIVALGPAGEASVPAVPPGP